MSSVRRDGRNPSNGSASPITPCLADTDLALQVDAVGRMYYHSIFKLNSILKRLNGKIVSKVPTHSGLCVVTFRIEEQYYDDFKCFVYDLTGGQSTLFVRNKTKLH